jgi:hypothetical protein
MLILLQFLSELIYPHQNQRSTIVVCKRDNKKSIKQWIFRKCEDKCENTKLPTYVAALRKIPDLTQISSSCVWNLKSLSDKILNLLIPLVV